MMYAGRLAQPSNHVSCEPLSAGPYVLLSVAARFPHISATVVQLAVAMRYNSKHICKKPKHGCCMWLSTGMAYACLALSG